jgi:hypothetical protein
MKQAALPEFGFEDDLLTMPHSVLVKVQFGGLLSLQRKLENSDGDLDHVDNIYSLITASEQNWGDLDSLPCQEFVAEIVSYKLPRRGRR